MKTLLAAIAIGLTVAVPARATMFVFNQTSTNLPGLTVAAAYDVSGSLPTLSYSGDILGGFPPVPSFDGLNAFSLTWDRPIPPFGDHIGATYTLADFVPQPNTFALSWDILGDARIDWHRTKGPPSLTEDFIIRGLTDGSIIDIRSDLGLTTGEVEGFWSVVLPTVLEPSSFALLSPAFLALAMLRRRH